MYKTQWLLAEIPLEVFSKMAFLRAICRFGTSKLVSFLPHPLYQEVAHLVIPLKKCGEIRKRTHQFHRLKMSGLAVSIEGEPWRSHMELSVTYRGLKGSCGENGQ